METHRLLITASDTLVVYKNLEYQEHLQTIHRDNITSLVAVNRFVFYFIINFILFLKDNFF